MGDGGGLVLEHSGICILSVSLSPPRGARVGASVAGSDSFPTQFINSWFRNFSIDVRLMAISPESGATVRYNHNGTFKARPLYYFFHV
jgi:hypothetical protein